VKTPSTASSVKSVKTTDFLPGASASPPRSTAHPDPQDLLDLLETPELLVFPDLVETMEPQEKLLLLAPLKTLPASSALLEPLDPLDLLDLPDLLDPMDNLVPLDNLEPLDLPDPLDLLEMLDQMDNPEPLEPPETLDKTDNVELEPLDLLDQVEPLDLLDLPDPTDSLVLLEPLDLLDLLDPLETLDNLEAMDNLELLVDLVFPDPMPPTVPAHHVLLSSSTDVLKQCWSTLLHKISFHHEIPILVNPMLRLMLLALPLSITSHNKGF